MRDVPLAWIGQTRPGGEILVPMGGWMHASELVRLTVHGDGTASGPVLVWHVTFMPARPQSPPPFGVLPDLTGADEEPCSLGADALDDWTTRYVAQSAAPTVQRLTLPHEDGRTRHVLLDVTAQAWACLTQDDAGHWSVRQTGPERLWDTITERITAWRAAGEPGAGRLRWHAGPDGQRLAWD
ncbi:hypothetical protein [Streptomyces sp. ICBB 8177]|uniref:hypothetical protein n=1 Tax=Streptomyces sp. ICBB 8177 TaxID=563922 RepID=UPI0023AEBBAF|nr:hypothetical protein [Streptomyces sp. ICBB 8177]